MALIVLLVILALVLGGVGLAAKTLWWLLIIALLLVGLSTVIYRRY